MKKILFVCDGDNFSIGAFALIKLLQEKEPISVKGIFFTPVDFQELIPISYIPTAEPYVKLKSKERMIVKKSKESFIKNCDSLNISFDIHDENEEWTVESFAKETRFADLAIISEELFCADLSQHQPNIFMQEALRHAECAVILVPENFKSIDRIVVAYDGKKESMFALRQFSHLLSQFTDIPSEFVFLKNEENDEIPDADLLKEYARLHFNSISITKLHIDPKKYFASWTNDKKNILLVAGSFSRSVVSELFKSSFSAEIIHGHQLPVFIAHHS